MRLAWLTVVVALAVNTLSAQQALAQADAQGWRGARWGMTLAQVLSAFPGEARRLDSAESVGNSIRGRGATRALIDTVDINGARLTAHFLFSTSSDSLVEILLRRFTQSGTQSEYDYVRLLSLLTSKYGPRSLTHEARARSTDLWSLWLLRQTTIELSYSFSQFGEMVSLWYRPTKPADRGKV
jgi:hypothetical protein